MKKFLKIIARHPVSVPGFIVMAILSIACLNPAPVILAAILCPLLFVIGELSMISLKWEKEFWQALIRLQRHSGK